MNTPESFTYEDIDWEKLWQNARKKKSWRSKDASDWDKKAPSFAARNRHSAYVALVLSRLPLNPSLSVLDIGSGPGTLALPLAAQVKSVTAIDYSQAMVNIMKEQAARQKIGNLTALHSSWEDDWHTLGVEPHDIAIASRSMNVADLPMAIDKIHRYGRKYIFITDRIAPSPFDPAAFTAVGRNFDSGPDYIYTVNILYNQGIHPCVEVLELERDIHFNTMEEALDSYSWMFKELTAGERGKLEKYLQSRILSNTDEGLVIRREFPPRWAMIWWKKDDCNKR